ncbi:Hypothetical predicted protein, partial [Marmota monax]
APPKEAAHLGDPTPASRPAWSAPCHGFRCFPFSAPQGAPPPPVCPKAWHLQGRGGEELGDSGPVYQSLPAGSGQVLPHRQHSESWGERGGCEERGGVCTADPTLVGPEWGGSGGRANSLDSAWG